MERQIRRQPAPLLPRCQSRSYVVGNIGNKYVRAMKMHRPFFVTSIELFSSCCLFPHVSSLPGTQLLLGRAENLGIAGNLVSPPTSLECRCYVRESRS